MKLPAAQVAVLDAASATEDRPIDRIADAADLDPAAARRAAFALADEGLVAVAETETESLSLSEEGDRYREAGLPEVRLYEAAHAAGAHESPVPLGDVLDEAGLSGEAVDIALANFARKGLGEVDAGAVSVDPDAAPEADPERATLDAVAAGETDLDAAVRDRLLDRGLLVSATHTDRTVTLTDEGITAQMEGIEVAETVGKVTPELLTSGEWRDVEFAEYNVEADAETIEGGREHILRQTANRVKDVLVGMGFSEMEGPHVDAQFWINDCLFMPQ
ncbi:MAG: phenylalanine--tRNA ligase subunit alpha, partial [Halobacteriales archaeon]